MITREHVLLRFSEPDDAAFLQTLYIEGPVRAALLDGRREPMLPTRWELTEMLTKRDAMRGLSYTVEDREGRLIGWCGLRGISYEARYAEIVLVLKSELDYHSGAADEALTCLMETAFAQFGLAKVIATCLDAEPFWRDCLCRQGFFSCGVQRHIAYSGGAWRNLETFARFASVEPAALYLPPEGTCGP